MKNLIKLVPFLFINAVNSQPVCRDFIPNSWDDSRYRKEVIAGDSIVTDIQSGLIWKQCSEGLSGEGCDFGMVENVTWQGALEIAKLLNQSSGFAGYLDWRLPNLKELNSLLALNCSSPSINVNLFPNTLHTNGINYWTSTPSFISNTSWGVDFFWGETNTKLRSSDFNVVRLVRGGE